MPLDHPRSPFQDERVVHAFSLIDSTNLRYPADSLLKSFIEGALNPVSAACYVTDRLTEGDAQSLLSDWVYIVESVTRNGSPPKQPSTAIQHNISSRDGGKCCITGKKGSISDPLCVVPILPVPIGWITQEKRISDILGAFFGPPYRDWWLNYAKSPGRTTPYRNHWLVRRSAAAAFADGFVYLDRLHPSMIEYRVKQSAIGLRKPIKVDGALPLLGDHSRTGIQHADARFIGTHARLCNSIRYLDIARTIAPEILGVSRPAPLAPHPPSLWHQWPIPRAVSGTISTVLPLATMGHAVLTLWLVVPNRARIAAYELLRKLGRAIYGPPTDYSMTQRLPFGLYLKYRGLPAGYRNEFKALQLVRKYTTVPVPKALDIAILHGQDNMSDGMSYLYGKDNPTDGMSDDAYLLISRLPGIPLSECHDVLSDGDLERIAAQMRKYLAQIRSIPNLVNRDAPICNALGEACRDSRIRGESPVGPFPDEASFSQMLRFPDEPSRRGHMIVFTHADLNPRNILVAEFTQRDGSKAWGVTGIVDWEFAGYYPEYWDCTKAQFEGFRWLKRHNDMMKDIFKGFGDYSKELDVENRSWEMGDGV
ncbi:hypothetical protein F5Y01DRAFT_300504 [Xylaria sp. FL0043]|nr:hypothetical protein F5Y01DRAFT_300504 [Xylaria sp. FL0043]